MPATARTPRSSIRFVQFYPTLLEIAKAKGTLNPSYKP